jgi:hypothetical protein
MGSYDQNVITRNIHMTTIYDMYPLNTKILLNIFNDTVRTAL